MATNIFNAVINKVWENLNPTSGFSAGDVQLSGTGKAYIVIGSIDNSNSEHISSIVIPDGKTWWLSYNSASNYWGRSVSINGTTVTFSSGYFNNASTNNAMVPQSIYALN